MNKKKHLDLVDTSRRDQVDRYLPLPVRPYTRLARLNRQVGIWRFYLIGRPFSGAHGLPDLRDLLLFTPKTITPFKSTDAVMRGYIQAFQYVARGQNKRGVPRFGANGQL
ncbi:MULTISPECIES: hypothetical protein [Hyphomicrobiales]|uniref:hypothetical protein n=1 Tax=Hyphomicrobiales TaxID=356 RepID=UPI001F2F7FC2|nr:MULTISPECIES: hypothetical protein [Hyphomicrobiales]